MLTPVRGTRKIGFYDRSFTQSKDRSSSHGVKFNGFSKSHVTERIAKIS